LWFAAVQPSTRPDIQFSGHFGAALRRKLQLWKFITVPFAVRPHIESFDLRSYIRRDLAPQHEGMMKIDLQQIPFPHETFDLVICDHMLEHVDDPAAALREMRRVLKPGGRTICQTPYSARLTTTSEARSSSLGMTEFSFYGQDDHVRLFGSDIERYFIDAGFIGRPVGAARRDPAGRRPGTVRINERKPFFDFVRG